MPIYYILPLLAGFIYAIAVLLSKRALDSGVGIWRALFVSNWLLAVFFIPLYLYADSVIDWSLWYWPLFSGTTFFVGQVATFAAIQKGDVSVQAPIMGTKAMFVALLTVVFSTSEIPIFWWIGAILTAVAVFLLNSKSLDVTKNILHSILLAVLSAFCFAVTDLIVQEQSYKFGYGQYAAVMFMTTGLLSFFILPMIRGKLFEFPRKVWLSFLVGKLLLAFQAMILYVTLCHYGRATAVNILYSSRGVWSIALVWFVGHWFANQERHHAGTKVMAKRLVGAVLMVAAIGAVLGTEG